MTTTMSTAPSVVRRTSSGSSSLAHVVDLILDKGLVIHAFGCPSSASSC
jgi:hypothetical protein